MPRVCSRICSSISSPSECGGSTQAESPEWIPASSTCCMMPPIQTSLAVAERVDVDLDRVLEEAVEEDLAPVATGSDALEIVGKVVERVDDLHRAAAEHVARSHEQREADLVAGRERLLDAWPPSRTAAPCSRAESSSAPKRAAVLGGVDRVDARPEHGARRPRCSPAARRSGVWPPNCTITPSGCSSSTTASTSSSVSGSK